MRKFILISMITLASVSLGACRQNVTIKQDAPGQKAFLTDGQIYDLHSGKIISSSELLADLATAQHLIIGEKHDNAEHHQIELWLIQNLLIQRPQGSVLLEMLTSEQQPRVNQVKCWLKDNPVVRDSRVFGPVHYQQITILHASLVHRFTAGAQKEGGCRSADAIAVQIQFLLSIISGRRRKTGLATIGKPVAGKITVSPVTSLKFLLRPRAPCRCWDVHHSRTLRRNRSLSRMGSHRVLTRRKKVARKRKAVDVRPRSQSLSRNRRRGRITGFQTTSRSDRADCDNRPALCGASPEI
ncbi:putative inner membrane lipoprotein [Escherichia coli]|nr:putative inner membrane lipoprotein [Escherichia coli]